MHAYCLEPASLPSCRTTCEKRSILGGSQEVSGLGAFSDNYKAPMRLSYLERVLIMRIHFGGGGGVHMEQGTQRFSALNPTHTLNPETSNLSPTTRNPRPQDSGAKFPSPKPEEAKPYTPSFSTLKPKAEALKPIDFNSLGLKIQKPSSQWLQSRSPLTLKPTIVVSILFSAIPLEPVYNPNIT